MSAGMTAVEPFCVGIKRSKGDMRWPQWLSCYVARK